MTDAEVAVINENPTRVLIQTFLPFLDEPPDPSVPDAPVARVTILPEVEPATSDSPPPLRIPSLDPVARRAIIDANLSLLMRAAAFVYARYPTWLTADDLANDAWIMADRILARWCPALGRNMSVEKWLYIVLINALIDHVRQQCRCRIKTAVVFVAEMDSSPAASYNQGPQARLAPDVDDQLARKCEKAEQVRDRRRELVIDVESARADMTELQRTIVRLRFEEDLTLPEIVARVGIPIGRVRTHLQEALRIVERFLGFSAD